MFSITVCLIDIWDLQFFFFFFLLKSYNLKYDIKMVLNMIFNFPGWYYFLDNNLVWK